MAALSLFFKADQLFVTGTSRYSREQVIQASGIRQGENLFLLNKNRAADNITGQLPYVESVRIWRQLPNVLRIEVTECSCPLAIRQDGVLWLVNGSGKLIDCLGEGQGSSYPLVTGLTLTSPQLGQTLQPEESDREQWQLLQELWQQLLERDMAGDVQELHLEEAGLLTLRYQQRLTVQLRAEDDFAYRLNYLSAVVERLDSDDRGTIQWDSEGKAHFIPE